MCTFVCGFTGPCMWVRYNGQRRKPISLQLTAWKRSLTKTGAHWFWVFCLDWQPAYFCILFSLSVDSTGIQECVAFSAGAEVLNPHPQACTTSAVTPRPIFQPHNLKTRYYTSTHPITHIHIPLHIAHRQKPMAYLRVHIKVPFSRYMGSHPITLYLSSAPSIDSV